jgi:uracil phosphoribosyltransferase
MTQPHAEFPNLQVFSHPLIQHKLTWMRDRSTSYRAFRALLAQIAGLMVYEVTRSFETVPVEVETPMTRMIGRRLASTITVVPVLRAGLGMADGVLEVMPEARVGHLGMARDEETLKPKAYLNKLPRDLEAGPVILVDPMLATGGSAAAALKMLRDAGATDLRMICLVAAPEGVGKLLETDPEVRIYTAALDERLDDRAYILPGLGDAGDRMYGTEQ